MRDHHLPRGILKSSPDTFVVQELVGYPARAVELLDKTVIRGWDGSPFTVFTMTKEGWTTSDACREVARQLGVRPADVSCHGRKDKHALTSQLIGVKGAFQPAFSHPQIFLKQLGGRTAPLAINGHGGNRFNILIKSDATTLNLAAASRIPNFFGKQRLGTPGSEESGRLILEGDFAAAAKVMHEHPEGRLLERIREKTGSWKEACLHPDFSHELRFDVQKWQSYLWNGLLRQLLYNSCPERLPAWSPDPETRERYRHLWDPQHLDRGMTSLLPEFTRPTGIEPRNLRAERKPNGWNLTFDLPNGAFATEVLRHLFDLREPKH